MDVGQVRDAFLGWNNLGHRLKSFRDDRVDYVLRGGTPFSVVPGPEGAAAFLAHIVSLDCFGSTSSPLPIEAFGMNQSLDGVRPLRTEGHSSYYNLDGYFSHNGDFRGNSPITSYVQVLRKGAIEFLESDSIGGASGTIPLNGMEFNALCSVSRAGKVFKALEIPPPFAVFVSLLNVEGRMRTTRFDEGCARKHLGTPNIMLQEVVLSDQRQS